MVKAEIRETFWQETYGLSPQATCLYLLLLCTARGGQITEDELEACPYLGSIGTVEQIERALEELEKRGLTARTNKLIILLTYKKHRPASSKQPASSKRYTTTPKPIRPKQLPTHTENHSIICFVLEDNPHPNTQPKETQKNSDTYRPCL